HVNGTASGIPMTINDDAGTDTVNVGNGSLDNLLGAVTVNGGGADAIIVNDSAASFNDTYTITSSTLTRVVFGGLTYSSVASLTLTLTTASAIDNLIGTALKAVLSGNSLANSISGLGGNDNLTGGGGDDSLDGGAGNDNYVYKPDAALGADTITDTSGTDTID